LKPLIYRIFFILSVISFLLALLLLGRHLLAYQQGRKIYHTAIELASSSDPADSSALIPSSSLPTVSRYAESMASPEPSNDSSSQEANTWNLAALRQVNPEVLGWITIPDTILSYPVMKHEDNEFYLNRAWDGSESIVGSIYLETQCSSDFSDFNTIVYGHRMKDSSMFGSLKHYEKQDYLEEHPDILITDDSGTKIYRIYSAFEAEITAPIYLVRVTEKETKQAVIDYTLSQNILKTEITPTTEDQLLTLCTCTGDGYDSRFVVIGVRIAE